MVLGSKNGTLSEAAYVKLYVRLLDDGARVWLPWLLEQPSPLKFLCYCRDGVFCHTNVLIDYLVERHPDKFARSVTAKCPRCGEHETLYRDRDSGRWNCPLCNASWKESL